MEQILCTFCGDFFDPSPRHKNQIACKKSACQKAKKAARQRYKMKHDPVYRANQKSSNQKWIKAKPEYWRTYREQNPEKVERNRILQVLRNRKARFLSQDTQMDTAVIAKMYASKGDNFQVLGQFWLIPMVAKMHALKVNMIKIPIRYP